jgi:KaiC/GvpD/RAD55 family RecA-like ATPase
MTDPSKESGRDDVIRLTDEGFGSGVFEPIEIGIPALDRLMSADGGITRGSMTLTFGDPGAGKSTVMMKILSNLQANGHDVLFVSAEMNKLDVAWMARRFPEYADLPIWYVDYRTEDPLGTFIDHLQDGYDFVVVDSLATFSEFVAMDGATSVSKKKAQQKMLSACTQAMEGVETDAGTYFTSFSLIQQVNKSGNFAGSKMLEHMVTAALQFRVEGTERYMQFGKNRRGGNTNKLYFEFSSDGIRFDEEKLDRHEDATEFAENERERARERESNDIMDLLGESASVVEDDDEGGYRFKAVEPVEMDKVTHEALDARLDKEVVREYIRNTGPIQDAYKQLQADGHVPESASRYFFVSFTNRHELADRQYAA